jgi:hypothetical protein
MTLWKRPPIRLTERERDLIAFRFANPQLSVRQITSYLLLKPGELSRLLQLKEGQLLLDDLAYDRTVLPWQDYRLSPKLYLRAITTPGK